MYKTLVLIMVFLFPVLASNTHAQEAPPAKVVVAKISLREVAENQAFTGTIYYDRSSQVSSEVAGRVEVITILEGDSVAKGAPMVRLNTELLEKEIDLGLLRVDQAALRSDNAEKNFKRLESLYKGQGVSEKLYEDALYTYQDSQKEKEKEDLELEKLLIKQEKSVIKAPYGGVILEKNVDSGDWIQQGRALVRIGSADDLYVRVPVAEDLLAYFKAGEQVMVRINAFDRELTGTVEDYAPLADVQTKNVFLKVKIAAQKKIAENMSATVFVPVSDKKKLSIIPRDALVKFQGQDFVYTIKEGKAAILPVNIVTYLGDKVGADNPYFVEGMAVVVEGNERLRPDQPVVVSGEK